MPTISGLRRRGYTAKALKKFIVSLGVAKREAISDFNHLEHYVREDLNLISSRVMAVLHPVKLIIQNYPEDKVELLDAENNPENKNSGLRQIPFSRELYIEREDFMEEPPKKFFRLSIGKEVRLKHGYYVKCTDIIKDDKGVIVQINCTYDPLTKGGWSDDGRKVKGTIHWVSANHAIDGEVRLYDRLFNKGNPIDCDDNTDFTSNINPDSMKCIKAAKLEPCLSKIDLNKKFQFLRKGYFVFDANTNDKKLIFNQTVALRSSWG